MSFQVTEVQRALRGADYPMNGKQLAALAEKNGAPAELVELLQDLNEVEGPSGVMKQLKGPPRRQTRRVGAFGDQQ